MKRASAVFFAAVLLAGNLFSAQALGKFPIQKTYHGQFSDVSASAWYAEDVAICYELGLMSGKSAARFAPDDAVTYAEAGCADGARA